MKILLIEDEMKTAQSIKSFLTEAHGFEVEWVTDGQSGLNKAKEIEFDAIITDIMMPFISGIELCKRLRSEGSKTPILMLSALYQAEDKINGLNAGADDYLAKPFNIQELLARIYAITRRIIKTVDVPERLIFSELELDINTLEVWRSGQKINLTPKEFALLEYLIRNQNRVVPKLEILEKVWNLNDEINTNVIEVYVNYIRNKVDKNFPKKLIHTHFGVGYYLKDTDS